MKKIIKKVFKNYEYRNYFLAISSLIITIAFLIYNFYLGVVYNLVWNISINFYYLVLIAVKALILLNEKKWKNIDKVYTQRKRLYSFKIENILLIIMDVTLIVPITLMVLEKRIINIGMIPAIAVAAYTTFKVTMSIIGYKKTKKLDNFTLNRIKTINIKESIVSVLTLQNILIMTFNEGESLLVLTSYTSAGMLLLLIGITIYQMVNIKKITF